MKNPFNHQLYNWHLEISSKCPLKCPRCIRQRNPTSFKQTELPLDFIKEIFNPTLLKEHVMRITFSGGVGDAIYHTEFLEIARYMKTMNPHLQLCLVTNGSHKTREWWQQLASILNGNDEVIFSIDGWDHDSNNVYRKGSDWTSLMTGFQTMAKASSTLRWQTIVFKYNQDKLDLIQNLARDNGADLFYLIISDLFGSHQQRYRDPETGIDPLEPDANFVSSIRRTQRFKVKFDQQSPKMLQQKLFYRKFDPLASHHEQQTRKKFENYYIMPTCRFGYRGNYIDYQGIFYPCSWVSHPFEWMYSLQDSAKVLNYKQSFWYRNKHHFNLFDHSLEDVLSNPLWSQIEEQWKNENTMALICERKCLKEYTNESILKAKDVSNDVSS